MRKIELEWETDTPNPHEVGPPPRLYQIMPDGSREQVTLEVRFVEQ